MKNKRFLLVLLLAFLLQPNLHQLNSDSIQEKKDQEALQHEVTVTLKLVQVYVTDKKGNPAMDLTQDDFILYDNGKVQTITEFERHILTPTEKEAEKGPVKTKQTLRLKTPQRNRRKFFLLIDLFRNDIYGFALSKKAAIHFIETQLSPEDEVTVMSYSFLKGLIIHEYLSTEHEKAKETIQRLKEIPGPTANDGFSFEFNVKMTWSFIGDIKNFAKSLKLIPGHKNLLFFSAGISQSLLYSRNYPEIRSRYEEMCRELSAADASVFTVNTEGIRGYAKWGLRPGDHALKILSDATGGKYYHDVDHYRYIAEDIQYFVGNYYILGFYINEKWDGKYHKIKVEVKRKGYQIAAQRGYFNPKPFTEYSEIERRLHLIDMAFAEDHHLEEVKRFPMTALSNFDKDRFNLILISKINPGMMKDILNGKIEIVTFLADQKDKIIESNLGKVNLASLLNKKIFIYTILNIPSGEYDCRFVIRNSATGKSAVASTAVTVPYKINRGLELDTPLILVPSKDSVYIQFTQDEKKRKDKKDISLADIYSFSSQRFALIIDELEYGIQKIAAVIKCNILDIDNPEIKISIYSFNHSSEKRVALPFTFQVLENKKDSKTLLLDIDLPDMEPGEYSLEFTAEETNTKLKSQMNRAFIVR